MGAWSHFSEFIEEVPAEMGFKKPRPRYAARPSAASTVKRSERKATCQSRLLCLMKRPRSRTETAWLDCAAAGGSGEQGGANESRCRALTRAKSKLIGTVAFAFVFSPLWPPKTEVIADRQTNVR